MSEVEHQEESVAKDLVEVNDTTANCKTNLDEEDGVYLDELEYSDSDEDSEEVETIDVTNEPLYHILSAFLEDEEGANLIDKLTDLTTAVKTNTKVMSKLLKGLSSK